MHYVSCEGEVMPGTIKDMIRQSIEEEIPEIIQGQLQLQMLPRLSRIESQLTRIEEVLTLVQEEIARGCEEQGHAGSTSSGSGSLD